MLRNWKLLKKSSASWNLLAIWARFFFVQNKYFEQVCRWIRDGDYTGILINNWKCSKICNMEQEFCINWYYWHISCISSMYNMFWTRRMRMFIKAWVQHILLYKCVAEHVLGNCGWLCRNAISQPTEKFNYREDFSVQLSKSRDCQAIILLQVKTAELLHHQIFHLL
jgi:hypothetical protein